MELRACSQLSKFWSIRLGCERPEQLVEREDLDEQIQRPKEGSGL